MHTGELNWKTRIKSDAYKKDTSQANKCTDSERMKKIFHVNGIWNQTGK